MNSATGILHHQARVDRIDPVAMLKYRVANLFAVVVTWNLLALIVSAIHPA